jgi:dihydroxyacetone kinase-like protein
MNAQEAKYLFEVFAKTFETERDYLGRLDAAIGDGDHGAGMARGFAKARDAVASTDPSDVGLVFQTAGRAIMAGIGGASGALFATFFLEIGKASAGSSKLEPMHLITGAANALQAISRLGKTQVGDKTMLDALAPAVEALATNRNVRLDELAARAAEAARQGAEATKDMPARRGRAQYVTNGGLGHPDPGAVSVAYIFEAMREVLKEQA